MRRLHLILVLSLMPAPVAALPGDGHVRITERTPPTAARPARRAGQLEPSSGTARPRSRRRARVRRRTAVPPATARLNPADQRQGWQLLGAIADRLREMSEAWFEAGQQTEQEPVTPSRVAVREEAYLLTRVLAFCRRQAPNRPEEQAAWRRACDELLHVARGCAAEPPVADRPVMPHPVAATRRPGGTAPAAPQGDPLQRLEQMDDAIARAQEIVARYDPAS